MVDINDAFPSKYLKATDLKGREVNLKIHHIALEDIGSGEHKLVAYFHNTDRGLVVNKTNANTIASITGQTDTDMWADKDITIMPDETDFQGKRVPCIRVKLTNIIPPTPVAPLPPNVEADDIPF